MPLVIFGLLVSIPIIVWGSQLVIKLMDRYPFIITLGGMLLGWIAGQMIISDPVLKLWADAQGNVLRYGAPSAGALLVLIVGKWLAARALSRRAVPAHAMPAAAPGRLQHVLLAVDGSDSSAQAVRYLIGVRQDLRQPDALDVYLLNVQRPVSGDVSRFVAGETLKDYHLEGSERALAPARALLDAAGLKYQEHRRIGDPALHIAEVAQEKGCDLVVMGTRGLGSHAASLIGSVAQATVAQCPVPVLLVK
jgi:nucleotide-binding universal stress UspA family protein